jgi:hypothetical protein
MKKPDLNPVSVKPIEPEILRLDPAFEFLGIGRTTGHKWINAGILERVYVGDIPFITVRSIKRAAANARTDSAA